MKFYISHELQYAVTILPFVYDVHHQIINLIFFEAFFIFQKNVERKRLVSKIEFTLSRNIVKTTTCHILFFTLTLSRLEDKRNNAMNAVFVIKDTKLQLFPNHAMSLDIFEG